MIADAPSRAADYLAARTGNAGEVWVGASTGLAESSDQLVLLRVHAPRAVQSLGEPRAVGWNYVAGGSDQLLPAWTLSVAIPRLRVEGLAQGTTLLNADSRYHRVEDRNARGALAVRVGGGAGLRNAGSSDLVQSRPTGNSSRG